MRNSLLWLITDFIGYYSKRDRHKYKEWGWKKNDMMSGVFRIHWNIYDKAFSWKKLTAENFIVDIRPGSKYSFNERNKLSVFK